MDACVSGIGPGAVLFGHTADELGAEVELYHEAWWAKRRDEGSEGRDDLRTRFLPAAGLAEAMGEVPCIVFALAFHHGPADSVIRAVQNLTSL